jgi:superfamily II DNA helicase RecQ
MVQASIKDGELRKEAVKTCKKQIALLPHGSRMVVYCRTKAECKGMASELGCGFFYSGAVRNDEVLETWKEDGRCVVATSALGTGVNYPGIKLAMHVGMPYGLIDFA